MSTAARILTRVADFIYSAIFRAYMPLQTFRYAFCGGINMAQDLILYFVAYNYIFQKENLDLGLFVLSPHIAALCVVFPITFLFGFWLNRNIAFRHSTLRGRTQLMRYGLSVAGALAINYLLMKVFVEAFHFYPTPSKGLTTVVSIAYSYLMQKYFTFQGSDDK